MYELTQGDHKSGFKHLRVSNLIEFGRMVHAEMSALMEAARRGLAVQDGILVCTTFPCHMCARHIISAGVRIVYFTEPYPKSMTSEIYGDIIVIDPNLDPNEIKNGCENVYFYSFYGVAPKFFIEAFSMRKRKDKLGYAVNFNKFDAQPIVTNLSKYHLEVELVISLYASLIPNIYNDVDVFSETGLQ